jgi:tRNA pseudouridine55 synthase
VPDGLLLIDKPAGITSHDAVDVCRRAYGERSVGHLGTLDPFATGLLVLLFGRCTRLATFLRSDPKLYEATIRFGTETDTDDACGAPTRTAALPTVAAVHRAAVELTGAIEQVPPAYSAKQVAGARAYAAARRGAPLELAPVGVHVHSWEFRDTRGPTSVAEVDVAVTCDGGTYVRALARDLGRLAGSAAHCLALRRLRAGEFDVANATTLAELRDTVPPPPLRALRVIVDD